MSFTVFWDSFWFTVDNATTLIVFDRDIWTVVYAYSSRSYLFTGHNSIVHANSGSQLAFLQRFAGVRTLIRVPSENGAKEFPTERHGHCR